MERDLTEVMVELLDEIRALHLSVGGLTMAIERLACIKQSVSASEPPPERWVEKAQRFIQSEEAASLASKHALTTDTVAAVVGLSGDDLNAGHRKHIGKLLGTAGYSRVLAPGGRCDYRKLSNGVSA